MPGTGTGTVVYLVLTDEFHTRTACVVCVLVIVKQHFTGPGMERRTHPGRAHEATQYVDASQPWPLGHGKARALALIAAHSAQ